MPYNSSTSEYERRSTTFIDATPDGDTVAVAIDVKLDQGIDDYVTDLNHHATNGRHYPATSVASDSRFLKQSPAGVVSWADGVVAADAALKDMSNVASGAIAPAKIAQDANNRFATDTEKTKWNGALYTKSDVETVLTGPITSHVHDVGAVVISTGDTAPAGTLPAIGALVSRTTYSRLWAYAQTSGNISADDASWTKGQYSPGDGSTTFRVPNLQDQFIRGASGTRAVGNGEEDAIRNITGQSPAALYSISGEHSGAITLSGPVNRYNISNIGDGNGGESMRHMYFDASLVVPTADENRPKNVAYLMCIRY